MGYLAFNHHRFFLVLMYLKYRLCSYCFDDDLLLHRSCVLPFVQIIQSDLVPHLCFLKTFTFTVTISPNSHVPEERKKKVLIQAQVKQNTLKIASSSSSSFVSTFFDL